MGTGTPAAPARECKFIAGPAAVGPTEVAAAVFQFSILVANGAVLVDCRKVVRISMNQHAPIKSEIQLSKHHCENDEVPLLARGLNVGCAVWFAEVD